MSGGKLTPTDLVGTYTIVGGEKFGQPEPAERVAGSTVKFTDTTVTVTDKSKQGGVLGRVHAERRHHPVRHHHDRHPRPEQG